MKKWDKPQLVVLLRSSPSEAVLEYCKHNIAFTTSPNAYESYCAQKYGPSCYSCFAQAFS